MLGRWRATCRGSLGGHRFYRITATKIVAVCSVSRPKTAGAAAVSSLAGRPGQAVIQVGGASSNQPPRERRLVTRCSQRLQEPRRGGGPFRGVVEVASNRPRWPLPFQSSHLASRLLDFRFVRDPPWRLVGITQRMDASSAASPGLVAALQMGPACCAKQDSRGVVANAPRRPEAGTGG